MKDKEFSLKKEREKFIKDMDYLFEKINWGSSFLDADAVKILNEWKSNLTRQEEDFVKKVLDITLDDVSNIEKYKLIKEIAGNKLTGEENG